ncbi:MAG: hypothetical protein A2580_08970 [Hydrogenophilales bacterium RIFOXYD1_FULL_62_11]|nr:MAG: hypothetical protein A2580_08970 [Hydrogenophilales bacterium RIFOXYD1_FULL_62_11]
MSSSSQRDPRRDPKPGDILSFPCGRLRGRHAVREIRDGVVHYWDQGLKEESGLMDHVPLERWRKWYVGMPGIKVIRHAG